jgi:hypothetical protein
VDISSWFWRPAFFVKTIFIPLTKKNSASLDSLGEPAKVGQAGRGAEKLLAGKFH